MTIRDRRALCRAADETLRQEGSCLKQILLLYLTIVTVLSLGASVLSVVLSDRIAETGGLGGMGLRSVLSTVQTILPTVQTVSVLCLQLGFTAAVLNARRGEDFSRNTLLGGFRRLFPLLWSYILQALLYGLLGVISMYLGVYIFLLLPMSESFRSVLTPLMDSMSVMNGTLLLDDATMEALASALTPALWIIAALYLPLLIPTHYRYRLAVYRLIDQPRPRAMLALRESRVLMYRNRFALLKLDLHLWWYYALQLLAMVVCYGDVALALLGIQLPWSPMVSYFLFLILGLALQFAVFYFTMDRVTMIYVCAYEALIAEFEQKKQKMEQLLQDQMKAPAPPSPPTDQPWDDRC